MEKKNNLLFLAVFLMALSYAPTCQGQDELKCQNVPYDCETKCLNYDVDKETGCTTCQCVELNGLFEMDIKFDDRTEKMAMSLLNNKGKAAGTAITKWFLWQNKETGNWLIPYRLDNSLSKTAVQAIEDAIADYHANTCIQFIPWSGENKYILFFVGGGCWSYVGVRSSGVNELSIGNGCETKGIVIHELMHALGFWHEQSRPDRDDYIKIIWENIQKGLESQFQVLHDVDHYGSEYDTFSVMHYPNWAFSKNGKDTITRADGSEFEDYQRQEFAASDIQQINTMYQCSGVGIGITPSSGNSSTPAPTTAATSTESTCADILPIRKCEKAERKNKCNKKKVWKNCMKTCGRCSNAPEKDEDCKDDERYECKQLVDYCERSDDVMNACPLSCGTCK
ncbi:meprin A subunit beta-like isoform X1 [Styela clava]